MSSQGRDDGGAGPGLPWASLLDPVANARAFGEVQAQGLRAAGELVERLVRTVDGERSSPVPPGAEAGADGSEGTGTGDASRVVEAWIDLLRRTAASFGPRTEGSGPRPAGRGTLEIDVPSGAASGAVRVAVDKDGGDLRGPAEVWLHNGTATALGPLALHCGDLRTAEGAALAGAVTFDPAEVPTLPARSSRGVALRVTPEGELAPGTYRGLIQAAGAPDVWMPLEVVVDGRGP